MDNNIVENILNEISFIYRNQNFIFNQLKNQTLSPNNSTQAAAKNFSPYNSFHLNSSNSNNHNIYTNNNYEIIDPASNNTANLILIKQTNDIYFSCANPSNNINTGNNEIMYLLPPPPALPPLPHPIASKSNKISKSKLRPEFIQENFNSTKLIKKNVSPLNVVQVKKVMPKSRLTSPKPLNSKAVNLMIDKKKQYKKGVKANEKTASSGTIASSGFLRPSNNNIDKKFQRNTDHTQSIKLIKENLASLFLSKKPNHSNEQSNRIDEMADSDILHTIEIETNKNILNKQTADQKNETTNPTKSEDSSKKISKSSHDFHSR
jgi:hypothetical protein